MSENLEMPVIDKSTWGPGEWQNEPDRVDFIHAGFSCFALRHDRHGHWCGYVGVPAGHPAYDTDPADLGDDVGVNYGAKCQGWICHVPAPGMPEDVFWLGFDCGHAMELSPGMRARLRQGAAAWRAEGSPRMADLIDPDLEAERFGIHEVYRPLPYVRRKIEHLAEYLAGMARRVSVAP